MAVLRSSLDRADSEDQAMVVLTDRAQDLAKLQHWYRRQTDGFAGRHRRSAAFLQGQAAVKREGQEWTDVVASRRPLFTTTLCLLHALQHGFVGLQHVHRVLYLDSVPDTANQHPLCSIMHLFYWPLLGMNLAARGVWGPCPVLTAFVAVEEGQLDAGDVFKRHRWMERLQHYARFYDAHVVNTLDAAHLGEVWWANGWRDAGAGGDDAGEEQLREATDYRLHRAMHDPMVAQSSSKHFRTSAGALLEPTLSVHVLLRFCSSLPKDKMGAQKSSGLTLCTVPVRRLDANQRPLVDAETPEQPYFACKVVLPERLSAFMECRVDGPPMLSRHEAQAEAALAACLRLLQHGLLDEHLLVSDRPMDGGGKVDDDRDGDNHDGNHRDNHRDNHGDGNNQDNNAQMIVLADPSGHPPMDGLIPVALQDCPAWRGRYVYAVEWEWSCPGHSAATTTTALPPLTQWLRWSVDYMNSARGPVGFAIVLYDQLPALLPPIFVPTGPQAGGQVLVEHRLAAPQQGFTCTLKLVGELDQGEHGRLLEMQPQIFALLNVRPLLLNELDKSVDCLHKPWVPADKRAMYMLAPLLRQDYQYEPFNADHLYSAYEAMKRGAEGVHRDYSHRPWVVDWHFSRRIQAPDGPLVSDVLRDDLSRFSHLPDAEAFVERCLQQALLVTPYNGLCHRVRQVYPALTPNSPFGAKRGGSAKTHWEHTRSKYGIAMQPTDWALNQGPLLGVCRVENFADVSRWTLCSPGDDGHSLPTTTGSGMNKSKHSHNSGDQDLINKAALIPWLTRISTLPYAAVRALLLMPRVCGELEAQLLAVDYYSRLSAEGLVPGLSLAVGPTDPLIASLTAVTAMQPVDYERLEVLGDSILKAAVSVDVFVGNAKCGEGRLTHQRAATVCNANLCRIGRRLEVHKYARIAPFSPKLWTPPSLRPVDCGAGCDELQRAQVQRLFDPELRWRLVAELERKRAGRETVHDYFDHRIVAPSHQGGHGKAWTVSRHGQPVSDKTVADLVEASVGAVYEAFGWDACMAYLCNLGMVGRSEEGWHVDPVEGLGWLPGSPSGQQAAATAITTATCEQVETCLSYKFRERSLLLAALTHASTDAVHCNGRLEWLGDALIDWSVTKFYYHAARHCMSPFALTEARKAAVNNAALAGQTVRLGLHEHLRLGNADLEREISSYLYHLNKSKDNSDAVAPPKVLGDVLEAVVGAIFVDMRLDFASLHTLLCSHLLSPLLTTTATYAEGGSLPVSAITRCLESYAMVGVGGGDLQIVFAHHNGQEQCQVVVRGKVVGEAAVVVKKDRAASQARAFAKEQAARAALDRLLSHGV